MHIKKNDMVQVIAGREKGKTGKVIGVTKEKTRVLVEKVNLIKRHQRPDARGQGGIVEKEAFCREQATDEITGEFNRQVRITTRTLRAIFNYKSLLNPFNYPVYSFEVFSHKLMKFMAPFWMILILLANIYLAGMDFLFYQFALVLQLLFYLSAVVGFFIKKGTMKAKWIDLSSSYLLVNLSYAFGWFKYFNKETYTYWEPKR